VNYKCRLNTIREANKSHFAPVDLVIKRNKDVSNKLPLGKLTYKQSKLMPAETIVFNAPYVDRSLVSNYIVNILVQCMS
jgi:hypothetical protein